MKLIGTWSVSKLLTSFASISAMASFAGASPADWVKAADEIRNPAQSYQMKIKVESSDSTSVFEVFLQGQDKTLVVTREPARDRGRNMLMLDREFNAYVPNLKRSMKLSLAQKLQGQVANGDISRTRWHGDYDVKLEKSDATEHQLILKGVKENLTYAWIRLWLRKDNFRPTHAEYLGLNGKTVLKRAVFEDYKSIAGAVRPTTLKITDANSQSSTIRIESMNVRSNPDSFFTVRNMGNDEIEFGPSFFPRTCADSMPGSSFCGRGCDRGHSIGSAKKRWRLLRLSSHRASKTSKANRPSRDVPFCA